jgi:hypothetical protein
MIEPSKETYLGDGLYAVWDGYAIWLRAPRSEGDHLVCLEPDIMVEFQRFVASVKDYVKKETGS